MSHSEEAIQVKVLPPDKKKIKQLWTVALIMLAITVVEFIIAFTIPAGHLKTAVFVGLTIVKAGYIVMEFMHLKYEVKMLIWSILVPIVFIIWMLVAFLYEGMSIGASGL